MDLKGIFELTKHLSESDRWAINRAVIEYGQDMHRDGLNEKKLIRENVARKYGVTALASYDHANALTIVESPKEEASKAA